MKDRAHLDTVLDEKKSMLVTGLPLRHEMRERVGVRWRLGREKLKTELVVRVYYKPLAPALPAKSRREGVVNQG